IYEHIGSTIIDTLEFAVGNKMNVLLRIYRRNGENWERISLLVSDGAGRTYFSAENILSYGSSFFKVLVYDDSQNKYKFALSSPLAFAEGVKISLENVDSENNHHGGIFIKGREF